MKKSIMWILTVVMSLTFLVLLYFQIIYLENMVKMREEQFTEGVMRSLNSTSDFLERQETMYFLEQDANIIESSLYSNFDSQLDNESYNSSVNSQSAEFNPSIQPSVRNLKGISIDGIPQSIGERYSALREVIRSQYLYQKGLLNEVIFSILRESSSRSIMERADSTMIRNCLSTELSNNGVNVPFVFAIYNPNNELVYDTEGYNQNTNDNYTIQLFQNSGATYLLSVEFPTKNNYIFKTVRFVIPSMAFTVMLIIIFIYTLILAFRQKNLSEMKTDFINNMTHELKTPISSISLAGQMLKEPSIRKSESSLNHLSDVIVEESKRLRFQVEKVLQLSVFDKTGSTLKFTEVNANQIISNVVNTFKLKVEKQGGTLQSDLHAEDAEIYVDEMQFTNVIFNLLDNALKYMKEDTEPHLKIVTQNLPGNRLEIIVSDNGIGIKKEDTKRIFDKFYRVSTGNRHDVKGFGLGLTYVKKMITAFNGNIIVESEFGKGSSFIITLPLISHN